MTITAKVPPLLGSLLSREVIGRILAAKQRTFLDLFGSTPILLVHIGSADSELAAGLLATAPQARESVAATPIVEPMEFETVPSGTTFRSGDAAPAAQEDPESVATLLENAPPFAAPLRKRAGVDVAFNDRISVGRTVNKDIVLRHITVSKFHGWFELGEEGNTFFTEAGSKNGTRLNGKVVYPRNRSVVRAGDTIRFGSVDALLCSPPVFWEALQICAKR